MGDYFTFHNQTLKTILFLILNLNHNRSKVLGGSGRGLSGVTLARCFFDFSVSVNPQLVQSQFF